MLRKILLVLVFVSMIAIVGCKKEEPAPTPTSITEQANQAADQAAKDADAAKEDAGKELEKAGKELQK
ncbi:MAG: hypothetical protein LLF92_08620 [Planctomycetaceae bacterium]|nr:hypothetical protein [Planctomycetaceae bacterium]